jgi:hypothetical protein
LGPFRHNSRTLHHPSFFSSPLFRPGKAAKSESEQIETRERLEAAISELFTERQLYDHHRRSAHAMSAT